MFSSVLRVGCIGDSESICVAEDQRLASIRQLKVHNCIFRSVKLITQSANAPTGRKRGCMDLVLPELSPGPVVRLFQSLNVQDVPMLLF